ncbi:MAG: hypothetical protein AB2812_08450 [Candidatus Sedimenticola endophacoides]
MGFLFRAISPCTTLAHGMHVGKVPFTIYIDSRGSEFGRLSGLVDWDSGEARQSIRHCLLGQ